MLAYTIPSDIPPPKGFIRGDLSLDVHIVDVNDDGTCTVTWLIHNDIKGTCAVMITRPNKSIIFQ